MAQQVDSTVNEHPPEVRVLTLAEQLDAGLDADLGAALGQFRELIVGQAAEQAESPELVGASHCGLVAHEISLRMASPPAPGRGRRDG